MNIILGIDIGGTSIKIGVFEDTGTLLDKFSIPTNIEESGKYILPEIAKEIISYLEEKRINRNSVKGIGIGVPGPVSNGIVLSCANLGWEQVDVVKEFSQYLGFETVIKVGNDATLAAAGELWQGLSSKYQNLVMITLGTGVGGGIVIRGVPLDGTNGASGEIGHMRVDERHLYQCNCGLKGCLETVASATGVVRLAKDYLKNGKVSSLNNFSDLTSKNVFDEAKSGDTLAVRIVEEVGRYIALAASYVAAIVDPEVFVIGGGVSYAGQILIDVITKEYEQIAFKAVKQTPFVLAKLGNDGGIYGAAYLVK